LKQIRKRVTYANVMSSIAVFLVIGGATAFAALGKNTVGSKQLKANAVTTKKIKKEAVTAKKVKKGTLTGKQINLAKLGTVPSATNAAHATLADTIPPAEPTHLVGAAGEPFFEGGSNNVGASSGLRLSSVGFYKDHDGIVHLEGIAKVGVASPLASIFTLPPGYRPAPGTVLIFEPIKEATVIIGGSNTVIPGADLSGKVIGEEEEVVVLDGITYRPGS
jgi:hypothetical protein